MIVVACALLLASAVLCKEDSWEEDTVTPATLSADTVTMSICLKQPCACLELDQKEVQDSKSTGPEGWRSQDHATKDRAQYLSSGRSSIVALSGAASAKAAKDLFMELKCEDPLTDLVETRAAGALKGKLGSSGFLQIVGRLTRKQTSGETDATNADDGADVTNKFLEAHAGRRGGSSRRRRTRGPTSTPTTSAPTPPTASPTTFAPTPPTASPTTFAPTPTESAPWYNCPKDTDGTCSWFSCDSSRGATCNDNDKCVCNASQCAKGGRCIAKEEYRP